MEIKKIKIEEKKVYSKEELKQIFNLNKIEFKLKNFVDQEVKYKIAFLDTKKIVINGYPYGYKKTLKSFEIETKKKKGDRLLGTTLNPKTNKWNKPKKSTYEAIKLLVLDENGYIKTFGLGFNDPKERILFFENNLKPFLNEFQKNKIIEIKAYNKIMNHVSFEVKQKHFKNMETGQIKTTLSFFEMHKYKECDENGVLIDKEKEKQKEKETTKIINYAINKEIAKEKKLLN